MRALQLFHRGTILATALVVWICAVDPAAAQDAGYTPVASPFQEDIEYRVGADLRPRVDVDGVRWIRFSIRQRNDREYERDQAVPVLVEIDLLNNGDSADVLLIILFEDGDGNPLDRLELDGIKAGRDRHKEAVQKHKVVASVLEDTRRLYVFFEVSR